MTPLLLSAADTTELTGLVGWVTDVVVTLGPVGVALLVAIETIVPPIPSEVVLPFAGFVAGRGDGSAWVMTVAATVGSVVGAAVLYELGRVVGEDRTRRWLARIPLVEVDEVDRAIAWFDDHGEQAVLLGRFVPGVRSLVSLPAGAQGMHRGRFLGLTTAGSLAWNAVWVYAGVALGSQWQQAGRYSDVLSLTLVAALVITVAVFVWRRRDRLAGR